jgi:hypothetical protein
MNTGSYIENLSKRPDLVYEVVKCIRPECKAAGTSHAANTWLSPMMT